MSKIRKKKERMFNEDKHCRRCGVEMWLPESGDGNGTKGLTKELWNTMATIGHRYSKLDIRRITASGDEKRYSLICQKCNKYEANDEVAKLPIEVKWEKSKAYPQSHPLHYLNNNKRGK